MECDFLKTNKQEEGGFRDNAYECKMLILGRFEQCCKRLQSGIIRKTKENFLNSETVGNQTCGAFGEASVLNMIKIIVFEFADEMINIKKGKNLQVGC